LDQEQAHITVGGIQRGLILRSIDTCVLHGSWHSEGRWNAPGNSAVLDGSEQRFCHVQIEDSAILLGRERAEVGAGAIQLDRLLSVEVADTFLQALGNQIGALAQSAS